MRSEASYCSKSVRDGRCQEFRKIPANKQIVGLRRMNSNALGRISGSVILRRIQVQQLRKLHANHSKMKEAWQEHRAVLLQPYCNPSTRALSIALTSAARSRRKATP